jgi:hypothetical protein
LPVIANHWPVSRHAPGKRTTLPGVTRRRGQFAQLNERHVYPIREARQRNAVASRPWCFVGYRIAFKSPTRGITGRLGCFRAFPGAHRRPSGAKHHDDALLASPRRESAKILRAHSPSKATSKKKEKKCDFRARAESKPQFTR